MTNYDILKEYEAHKTPVPSYEELQNMNKAVNECMAANIKLVEENAQLKELLKECKELFVLEKGFMVKCIREETLSDIIAKIDEVLNANKA